MNSRHTSFARLLFLAPLSLWMLVAIVQCDSKRKPLLRRPLGSSGTGCYFIVLKDKASEEEMQQVMAATARVAEGTKVYSSVKKVSKAFTVKLSPYALEVVRRMSAVEYIEEEGIAVGVQSNPEWYLDRLDQPLPSLDSSYWPIGEGEGADVYILDSGINYDHEEFENRAKYSGEDPTDDYNVNINPDSTRQYGRDCHGHGTHVASLCGGKTYGSAKKVTLYSVRVLGCNNAGPWSVVLAGMDFAVRMAGITNRPTIISMSLSGDYYRVMNDAVTSTVGRGIHVVVAAGNGGGDSCSRSPASNINALTVGGTREGDGLYLLGPGTNIGECVDIFAPGERVLAADMSCNNCSRVLSGTSMSTPLVSGLLAIKLDRQPLLSPEDLKRSLIEESIKDAIDFTPMPVRYRDITPNRMATIQGSCGSRRSLLGQSYFSSPSFPLSYPSNLDCRWEIGGEERIHIRISIQYLQLEEGYDVVKVYEGCCSSHSGSLMTELTGDLGNIERSFLSAGNIVCVQFTTDGSISRAGFNGTYTKVYDGTNLIVPDAGDAPPIPAQGSVDIQVMILVSPRQARDHIKQLMRDNYKLTWVSSYRLGPDLRPFFDYIATNSSSIDTISYVEIGFVELNTTIQLMEKKGYFIKLLIDRIRGKNPDEPSYSVIFEPRHSIYETEVFLRDNYLSFSRRLEKMMEDGYNLISYSFCTIRGVVEVTSVYTRDKRLLFNIPIPSLPAMVFKGNLTFFEFTTVALEYAIKGFYPYSVEVYKQASSPYSFFSVLFKERTESTQGNWFRWSLNTTAARDLIRTETVQSWDVVLTTGYTYLGNSEHFIEFKRKGY